MPISTGTLRFISSEPRYSIYENADGDEVYLLRGSTTPVKLVDLYELDLDQLWTQARRCWSRFEEIVRNSLLSEDEFDQIHSCYDCSDPVHEDEEVYIPRCNTSVCQDCYDDNYFSCNECDSPTCNDDARETLGGETICDQCCDYHYSWCEPCDGYYHNDNSYEHEHDESCGCESPRQSFRVPNNGSGLLDNDTSTKVSLPSGVIDTEGMHEIAAAIRAHANSMDYNSETGEEIDKFWRLASGVSTFDPQWQTIDGNFTKRLSRYAYKHHALKVPPELVSKIGNIARAHSTSVDHKVAVTRDLNMPAEEFVHEDSCWWGSHAESMCCFKHNGGFGLRSFNGYDTPVGRAWVIPLKVDNGRLVPTFETEKPAALIVFNGYEALSGYVPARILAHMYGMTYRRVSFEGYGMYVNSGSGYLVAPEEIAEPYTDGCLSFTTYSHADLYDRERTLSHV